MKSTQCCAGWISNRLWLYSNRPNVSAVIYEKEINPPFNLPLTFFPVRWSKTYFSASPTSRSLTHSPAVFIHIRSPVKQCQETWPVESLLLFAELMPANFWIPPIFFRFWRNFFFLLSYPSSLLRLAHRWFIIDASVAGKKHKCGKQNFFANLKSEGFRRWEVAHGAEKQIHFWGEGSWCGSTVSFSAFESNENENPCDSSLRQWAGAKRKKKKIERLRIKRSFRRRRVNNALLSLGKFNGKEKLLRRKRASKDNERWRRKRDTEEKN